MKHPAKTYAYEISLHDGNREEVLSKMESSHSIMAGIRAQPNQQVFAAWKGVDGSEKLLPSFQKEGSNGRIYNIPSINLVVLHFDNAYFNWRELQHFRPKLVAKLEAPTIEHDILNDMYAYYGRCISCTLSLFAAMEALVSVNIKHDTSYSRRPKRQRWTSTSSGGFETRLEPSESFVGERILWLTMDEKLRRVLPQLCGKRFGEMHADEWGTILRLKKLRDDITHPKSIARQALFEALFGELFDYDFQQAMEAVKSFINFYARRDSQCIRDCSCNREW